MQPPKDATLRRERLAEERLSVLEAPAVLQQPRVVVDGGESGRVRVALATARSHQDLEGEWLCLAELALLMQRMVQGAHEGEHRGIVAFERVARDGQ